MAEIEGLVRALREGDDEEKDAAADRLSDLAHYDAANRVLIVEAGGIALLVELLRDGDIYAKHWAADELRSLAYNNDANAVAIAVAVGFDAVAELARGGRVTVDEEPIVPDAGVPAKRKAALVIAALLRACVPAEARSRADVQDVIRGVIGAYL